MHQIETLEIMKFGKLVRSVTPSHLSLSNQNGKEPYCNWLNSWSSSFDQLTSLYSEITRFDYQILCSQTRPLPAMCFGFVHRAVWMLADRLGKEQYGLTDDALDQMDREDLVKWIRSKQLLQAGARSSSPARVRSLARGRGLAMPAGGNLLNCWWWQRLRGCKFNSNRFLANRGCSA